MLVTVLDIHRMQVVMTVLRIDHDRWAFGRLPRATVGHRQHHCCQHAQFATHHSFLPFLWLATRVNAAISLLGAKADGRVKTARWYST